MNDLDNNFELERENKLSLKDYYFLIRNNLLIVSIIVGVSLGAAIFYAYKQVNIYQATSSLKITKPQIKRYDTATCIALITVHFFRYWQ